MNSFKQRWMKVRGLLNPSEAYFAEQCEAPTNIVQSELEQARDFAKYQHDKTSDYADTAVYVQGEVHDSGLFTAKTNILYDPSSANEPFESIFGKMNQDNKVVSVTSATEYKPKDFYHTHETIHLPHDKIMDEPSPLTLSTHKDATTGISGFPTLDDTIFKDYHS